MKTLNELLIENGHLNENNMILKMDAEYYEWEALSDISENTLKQFKYILMEFHFRYDDQMPLYYKILKKLSNTHQIIYMHCNRCGIIKYFKNIICSSIEISYIIKDNNQFTKDESIYPIPELETRNCGKLSKLDLNLFKLFYY